MNVIVYAIPVFVALMAAEFGVSLALGRNVYRFNDAVGSLTAGILSQLSGVFMVALSVGIYVIVHNHCSLFSMRADDWRVWVGALIAYDFLYYWNHRIDHEVGLFWAAHVVHHQSEAFNLSTALRQPSSGVLLGWIFYLPMAIAGVPPVVFVAVGLIDLLYQFWIHTELVGKLGSLVDLVERLGLIGFDGRNRLFKHGLGVRRSTLRECRSREQDSHGA